MDGWINVGGASPANWRRLVEVFGTDELNDDPRFTTNAKRMANKEALDTILERHFRTRLASEWLDVLEEAGLPAGPILSVREMLEDPQTIARDMVRTVNHPLHGTVGTIGFPVKFSRTPASMDRPAPIYGQHTREILGACGYSEEQIDAMLEAGAAAGGDTKPMEGTIRMRSRAAQSSYASRRAD